LNLALLSKHYMATMGEAADPELDMFDALASMLRTVDSVIDFSEGRAPVSSGCGVTSQATF
jgi:hypothetical protein